MVRHVRLEDAEAICGIYNPYITDTVITFEENPLDIPEMAERIRSIITADYPYLVWEEKEELLGYAYVGRWKERASYRFSAEDSIYLRKDCQGKGLGSALMAALLEEIRARGTLHLLTAGITMPNDPSVALHEKFGFKKCAHFNEVGFKFNAWQDVAYWQLIL